MGRARRITSWPSAGALNDVEQSMTIRYSLQRTDVWEAYWHKWRSGWKLKAAQIVIALSVFYIALNC